MTRAQDQTLCTEMLGSLRLLMSKYLSDKDVKQIIEEAKQITKEAKQITKKAKQVVEQLAGGRVKLLQTCGNLMKKGKSFDGW